MSHILREGGRSREHVSSSTGGRGRRGRRGGGKEPSAATCHQASALPCPSALWRASRPGRLIDPFFFQFMCTALWHANCFWKSVYVFILFDIFCYIVPRSKQTFRVFLFVSYDVCSAILLTSPEIPFVPAAHPLCGQCLGAYVVLRFAHETAIKC